MCTHPASLEAWIFAEAQPRSPWLPRAVVTLIPRSWLLSSLPAHPCPSSLQHAGAHPSPGPSQGQTTAHPQ